MARDVVMMTPKAWNDLAQINEWVNDNVLPITDEEHWGMIEHWSYPDDGYGDCDNYVLLKRKMLIEAGWPREALLITVVRDKHGDGHAVLTVKTDRGEFILDNETQDIVLWWETGYQFVKRQSQTDPNIWVSLRDPSASGANIALR
jgi:predicted transglutaminase-like cysteine proteinase